MHSLGVSLKELRNKRGLSQDDLAENLNSKYGTSINKGMISKWENDLGEPSLENARVLSKYFNVKLDSLLGIGTEYEPETIAAHHDGDEWTDEELKAIEDFKDFVRRHRNTQK